MTLTDEALADLLAEMAQNQKDGPPCEVDPATVSALVREVQELRKQRETVLRVTTAAMGEKDALLGEMQAELERLRKVEREHYEATHCHCGHVLTGWSEPVCDGCDLLPVRCYCEPLPKSAS